MEVFVGRLLFVAVATPTRQGLHLILGQLQKLLQPLLLCLMGKMMGEITRKKYPRLVEAMILLILNHPEIHVHTFHHIVIILYIYVCVYDRILLGFRRRRPSESSTSDPNVILCLPRFVVDTPGFQMVPKPKAKSQAKIVPKV
jgi:hypothetical protein